MGHGSGIDISSSSRHSHLSLFRRLVNSSFFLSPSSSTLGHGFASLSRTRDCHQLGEIQPPPVPVSDLSRCDSRLHSFQGFSLPSESREAFLNHRRISVLRCSASFFLACAPRSTVFPDSSCSRRPLTDAIPSAAASPSLGSRGRFDAHSLGLSLPSRSGVVVCSRSSPTRYFSGPSQPTPRLLVRRFGHGLGSSSPGRNRFQPVVSGGSNSFNQRKGTSCGGKRTSPLRTSGVQFHSSDFL